MRNKYLSIIYSNHNHCIECIRRANKFNKNTFYT